MVFVAAFLLGMCFASAGLIAKQINSMPGMQIANRRVHEYLSWLGALSNLVLPIGVVIIASLVRQMEGVVSTGVGLLAGALMLGMLRLAYPLRMLLTVLGLPVAILFFLLSLFI